MSPWTKSASRRGLIIALAVLGILTFCTLLEVGRSLENRALDLAYRLRPSSHSPADLLVVGIDEPLPSCIRLMSAT